MTHRYHLVTTRNVSRDLHSFTMYRAADEGRTGRFIVGNMYTEISGALWRFESTYVEGVGIATMWVTCVHWPGCDDDAEPKHGEFGLGECRSDSAFMVANKWFWDAHGIDYKPVLNAVSRAMATGDLADVARTDTPPPHAGEIH